jgi:hypothetical protein
VGGSFNYSQALAGVYWGGTNVLTQFSRIRINPSTLVVDRGDLRFATSSGQINTGSGTIETLSFAGAYTCKHAYTGLASANIDLRGTPFRVADSVVIVPRGYAAAGGATFAENRQVVYLTGGGECGSTQPTTALTLSNT